MLVILMRHGEAVEAETMGNAAVLGDSGRALTGKGRRQTRKVAEWLVERAKTAKTKRERPGMIWTSPLVRAVQTAEIAAGFLALGDEVCVRPELSPGADIKALLTALSGYRSLKPLLLVGHEPGLSALAASLLGERRFAGFKKSGLVAISIEQRVPGKVVFSRGLK